MRNLKNIIGRCETIGDSECRSYFVLIDYSLPLAKKKKKNPHWRLPQKANVNQALLPQHSHPHGHQSVWCGRPRAPIALSCCSLVSDVVLKHPLRPQDHRTLRILITSVAMGIESVGASWVSLNLSTSTCSSMTWAVYDFSFQRTIGNKGFFFIGLLLGYLRSCTYSNHCKRQHIFVVNGSSGLRFRAGCSEWRNRRPVSTAFAAWEWRPDRWGVLTLSLKLGDLRSWGKHRCKG